MTSVQYPLGRNCLLATRYSNEGRTEEAGRHLVNDDADTVCVPESHVFSPTRMVMVLKTHTHIHSVLMLVGLMNDVCKLVS